MLKALKNLVLSPRLWLSTGVICMVVSVLLGYHQVQMDAETALAQKIHVPNRVLVQEFSADTHENTMGELHILAEAAFDQKFRVTVGGDGASQFIDVIPIYPVSRRSLPLAKSLVEPQRRPVPRAQAAVIAEHLKVIERIETLAVGLMIFEAHGSGSIVPDMTHLYIGDGQNGPLVDLAGLLVDGADVLESSVVHLAENNITLIENALVVSPYVHGRGHATEIRDHSALQETLLWVSIVTITFGFSTMIFLRRGASAPRIKGTSNEVKAIGAFPAIDPFQPIVGQDELGEEQEESEPHRASRVMTIASSIFRSKSRP